MPDQELTAAQCALVETWERHMAAEFETRSVDATMATMTAEPVVNHVPVMTGGVGARDVRDFYREYFIDRHPPDTAIIPLTRTVGHSRIVDELIYQFTHTIPMPWMLPGVPPTGRHVEVPLVVVIEFSDGKISGERIYWDQASVLAQVGLVNAGQLPVAGAEAARKVLDARHQPSNTLIARANLGADRMSDGEDR
jgi:carboxymethylenebutenolidase